MPNALIGNIEFSDGACRFVYEDAHGQYLMGDEGKPMYGVWYVPREGLEAMFGDQPIILNGNNWATVGFQVSRPSVLLCPRQPCMMPPESLHR